MPGPPLSTMAAPEAAAPSRVTEQVRTPPSNAPPPLSEKILVTRDLELTLRAFFPAPKAPMKFNPIPAMNSLLRVMLKDEPSLVLQSLSNDQQLVLSSEMLPTREADFKRYFKVSNPRSEKANPMHICIGCHVLSNRSMSKIKFQSNEGNLLAWLKKERVFLESDSLGIDRPVTIGHFTKIDATITHLANFRDYLANQLMLVEIEADEAVELAPHLKPAQLEAMTNGDAFIPILPAFEIYRTHLSHGRAPSQVKTDVLGVKCASRDAKLLGEFFTRMASATNNDPRDGVFLPKGAVHLLGPQTYEQVLKDNNFFLTTVATVPINLEYGAWFAIIDSTNSSETDPVSLHDHLLRKTWFLRIESVDRNKCLIVTTKSNLPEARAWFDTNLEALIRKSIPVDVEQSVAKLPRRLDKPVFSASSLTYADALKKQFSLVSTAAHSTTDHTRPPRKRQAAIIDYDSDQSSSAAHLSNSAETLAEKTSTNLPDRSPNSPPATTATNTDYANELLSIKKEISELKALITTVVEQFTTAIASLPAPSSSPPSSNDMDTTVDTPTASQNPTPNPSDLTAVINELKHELAAFVTETRAMLQPRQFPPIQMTPMPPSIAALMNQCGSSS